MLSNNYLALLITLVLAVTWLRINDYAAHQGWVSGQLSRKIIHMGTGPIFVACWLLLILTPLRRLLAALVPALITGQFILVGIGVLKDEAAVKAMSRTGDPKEILRGPLFYGLVFVVITLIYWLDSPIGIIALMLMCGGDGLADIIGRRLGHKKLPWSVHKSWAGSFAMFAGGWIFSIGILLLFVSADIFTLPISAYFIPVTIIALLGTIIEALPFKDVDNLTVTAATILSGHWLF